MRNLGIGLKGLYDPLKAVGNLGGGLMSTILSYNPITYWPLNEISGTTAINYGTLGAAANGTYDGVTLNQIDGPGGTRAGLFDGVNDYTDLPTTVLNNVNILTGSLVLWMKVSTWRNQYAIIFTDGSGHEILFQTTATEIGWFHEWFAIKAYTTSNWFCMAMSWSADATEIKCYLNGELYTTITEDPVSFTPSAYSAIGCMKYVGLYFHGYLSNVAIFNSVLTAEQIAAIYAAGNT